MKSFFGGLESSNGLPFFPPDDDSSLPYPFLRMEFSVSAALNLSEDLDRVTGIIDLRFIIEFACLQVMKHLSRPTPKSGQIPAVYPCNIYFYFFLKQALYLTQGVEMEFNHLLACELQA